MNLGMVFDGGDQPVYVPNAPAVGWGGLDWGEIMMELALQHFGGENRGSHPWGTDVRRCRTCDVMWKGDDVCWCCGKSNKAAA